jgi:hypothetical protein
MADTYTVKNKKQGFFGKLGNSFASIPIGIIIIILGCGILWNNEKKNVINIKDVKEMRENFKDVSSSEVVKENEGKLIATYGTLDFGNTYLTDETFGISVLTPILERHVEVYQWVETSETTDDKTTYTYSKEWSEKNNDSTNFKQASGHENKNDGLKYKLNKPYRVTSLALGAFSLSDGFLSKLSATEELTTLEPGVGLPEGYSVVGKYITNSADLNNPVIGDTRISFTYGDYDTVSVLGKQTGSRIGAYTTKKNSSILKLEKGEKTGTELINNIESGNKLWKWISRLFGVILVCMGTSMLLSPLTTLIGYVPFLGKIFNGALGVVSASVGFAISLIVIGIAWLVYRPVVGVIMIIVSVGLIVLAKMYLSKKDAGKTEEVKEEKKEENKEEN